MNMYKSQSELIAEELWNSQFLLLPKRVKKARCVAIINIVLEELKDMERSTTTPGPKLIRKLSNWGTARHIILKK